MKNAKNVFEAVVAKRKVVQGVVYLTLAKQTGKFNVKPGQFVVLAPLSPTSVQPRPFTVVSTEENVFELAIKIVGKNTEKYAELKVGESINVTGPCGKPLVLDPKAKSFILVGGGIGMATLLPVEKKLIARKKKYQILFGTKSEYEAAIVDRCDPRKLGCIFETGASRKDPPHTGLVTHLLAQGFENKKFLKDATVIACGPRAMLREVAMLCKMYGNKCIVLVEELMACGTGSCKGCAIEGVDGKTKYVCTDGPAFDAEWIYWDKFAPYNSVRIQNINTTSLPSEGMQIMLRWHGFSMKPRILDLKSPLMNASGCLDIRTIEDGLFNTEGMGAYVAKGICLDSKEGNAMPRTCETVSGMINSIGLPGMGVKHFVDHDLPRMLKIGIPVIANFFGRSVKEFGEVARILSKTKVAAIEVNVSCPNIEDGGAIFGIDPYFVQKITKAVCMAAPKKFVIVKLTPNVTSIVDIAKAAADAGADAVSLVNTFKAMAIDTRTLRPKIGFGFGGLSGPAIRPIAVRMVHEIFKANIGIPIIGMGGITDADSAAEFFIAGASAVAIGTGGFGNKNIFPEVAAGLERKLKELGMKDIGELVGSLRT